MMSLMAAEIRSCAVLESAIHYIKGHILELSNQITVAISLNFELNKLKVMDIIVLLKFS